MTQSRQSCAVPDISTPLLPRDVGGEEPLPAFPGQQLPTGQALHGQEVGTQSRHCGSDGTVTSCLLAGHRCPQAAVYAQLEQTEQ